MGKLLASSMALVFLAVSLFIFSGTSYAKKPRTQVSSKDSKTKKKPASTRKSRKKKRSRRKNNTVSKGKRFITVKAPNPLKLDVSEPEKETPSTPAPAAPAASPQTMSTPAETPGPKVLVREVRHWSNAGYTRVVVDVDGPVTYTHNRLKDPDRLFLDIKNARVIPPLKESLITEVNDGLLKNIRASQYNQDTVRVVLDLASIADYKMLMLPDPPRLVVDVTGSEAKAREDRLRAIILRPVEQPETSQAAQPQPAQQENPAVAQAGTESALPPPDKAGTPVSAQTETAAAAQPQEARAQAAPDKPAPMFSQTTTTAPAKPVTAQAAATGPKTVKRNVPMYCIGTIVIDPGHGGKDTGAVGHGGLREKDVVLDIGLKLRQIIKDALGCKVVLTRDTDTFIDLDARPAKEKDADIFISIHANASRDRSAHGIETYLLNTTKDRHIMELAARENMMDIDKMGDLGIILKDLVLDTKREGSLRLAHSVHEKLVDEMKGTNGSLNDREVRQGPFWVLYGAEMPSILTEVGFITNPDEEKLLASPEYRRKLAWAIFDGIKDYINTTKVASARAKPVPSSY